MKVVFRKLNLLHLLIPLGIIFIALTFYFKNQPTLQIEILVLFGMLYVISAIIHHHYDKSLTFETIAEYILIAVLVIIIFAGAIL